MKIAYLSCACLLFSLVWQSCIAKDDVDASVEKLNQAFITEHEELDEDALELHVYTPQEISEWVEKGSHLSIVRDINGCQFIDDIQNRAQKAVSSSYQFLLGDMYLSGTCVNKDISQGIFYMKEAASKSYPAAMRRMAFYYEIGRYVHKDIPKSLYLMHDAALMGYVPARIDWVGMLNRGLGSPKDYIEAYGMLHNSVMDTSVQVSTTKRYLDELGAKMPENAIVKAMKGDFY